MLRNGCGDSRVGGEGAEVEGGGGGGEGVGGGLRMVRWPLLHVLDLFNVLQQPVSLVI